MDCKSQTYSSKQHYAHRTPATDLILHVQQKLHELAMNYGLYSLPGVLKVDITPIGIILQVESPYQIQIPPAIRPRVIIRKYEPMHPF